MLPKKGRRGSSMPGANLAIILLRSSGMIYSGCRILHRQKAAPEAERIAAKSTSISTLRICTSSTSPGSASAMATGPVRMCPPGPISLTSL